ncbi:MAG: hypothetical protein WCJ30_25660, partial [Deltaproteobacteria bacterium]
MAPRGSIGRNLFVPFPRMLGRLLGPAVLVGTLIAARSRQRLLVVVYLAAAAFPVASATNAFFAFHRARHVWPALAVLLVIALALLDRIVDDLWHADRARAWPRLGPVVPWIPGALFVVASASMVPVAVRDLAVCTREIRQQQLALTERTVRGLPDDARVIVNDAGVIAFFGGHRTVDVVGLTTQGLAESWSHGSGSVLEALEA